MGGMNYSQFMNKKNEIMKKAVGIDYSRFEKGDIVFDYEKMMSEVGYSLDEIRRIQAETSVGSTPLIELKNISKLARKYSAPGKGARIFIKDEAANPSGSYKARRASVSVYHAAQNGYKGVAAATSGNYGAAVASQAVMRNLDTIIVQEAYDSKGKGQPEILEKGRKCEAYGAEVIQLSVGPELFYTFLKVLSETGFFNASLYTPFGIAGVEPLGVEIIEELQKREGKKPAAVIATHAGGGNLTGTARGLIKAGAEDTEVIGASVDLSGLHMAGDSDFNRKSFTTGHTGFGVPFATFPDRSDVPRNAARALRYMDRYLKVKQGEVFYITELLAQLEGMQRGPAGNTSLCAAIALARELDENETVVVQETEYTGAGKCPSAQLTFARENGVKVYNGDPKDNKPGEAIVIPGDPKQLHYTQMPLEKVRKSYVKQAMKLYSKKAFSETELDFMVKD